MVRRTMPRLERRSHFTAKVRGDTGERMRYPFSITNVVVASVAEDCTNVCQRSISIAASCRSMSEDHEAISVDEVNGHHA